MNFNDIAKNLLIKMRSHIENREYLVVTILLILILIISFFNVVFQGNTLSTYSFVSGVMPNGPYNGIAKKIGSLPIIDPGASAWQYIPEIFLASIYYKSLEWPLWNPHIATGIPFAADMISAAFYPLNSILYIIPTRYLWSIVDFIYMLRLFIAGFFTYCFMREIKIGKMASFFSAISFMLNGYMIFYINMVSLNVEILVPAILYFFEKLFRKPCIEHCIYAALVVDLSILGGMPESTLFSFFFVGLYYLYRTLEKFKSNKSFYIHSIYWLFNAYIWGILLSLVLTLPFIEYLLNSWTYHTELYGLSYIYFDFDTISLIIPYFFGPIQSTWNGMSQYSILPYIGVLPFFFALLAISRNNNLKFAIFFILFSIFYILKTYGITVVNSFGLLPLMNVSIFYKYCFVEFALSISILAGIGFENLPHLSWKRVMYQSYVLILIIIIFIIANIPRALSVIPEKLPVILGSFLNVAIAFLILFSLIILLFFYYANPKATKFLRYVIILLLISELIIYIPNTRADRTNPFDPAPYMEFLDHDNGIYRIVGLNDILFPDTASAFNIFDVRELFPLNIDKYKTLINALNLSSPWEGSSEELRFTGDDLKITDENIGFLSLMNVKYILTSNNSDLSLGKIPLIDNIIKEGRRMTPAKNYISKTAFMGKNALFEHPPSTIIYNLFIPKNMSELNFSISLMPEAWSPDKGDGVLFEIILNESGSTRKIFSKYIDPKHNLSDRKWNDQEINLSNYSGKMINLSFVTLPGPNGSNAYDWAGWGELSLFGPSSKVLNLVYDKEIKIYKNEEVLPRAFIVHDAIISSPSDILKKMASDNFDPRKEVLIEKNRFNYNNVIYKSVNESNENRSICNIISYENSKIKINAEMESPGFVVITDAFYPGWKAYVDSQEREILVANYAFRAIFLSKGEHNIELIYDPLSFKAGLWMSTILYFVLLTYIIVRRLKLLAMHKYH